jgi:hypothetical protein
VDPNGADAVVREDAIGDTDLVETCARETIEGLVDEGFNFCARGNESFDAADLREDTIRGTLSRFYVQIGGLEFAPAFE